LSVQIFEVNIDSKKLILKQRAQRPEVSEFSAMPPTKWFEAIVQSKFNYGLFVRPAGFDSVGKSRGVYL